MATEISQRHIRQLDGLRCLAILMVLFGHWIQPALPWRFIHLYTFNNGVTLFFVLSGFLITGILLNQKILHEQSGKPRHHYIRSFFMRRVLRIFPVYYLLIALLWILNNHEVRALLPWLLTYTVNIYQAFHEMDVGKIIHLWSLSVEEQFYLIWPLLISIIPAKRLPWLFGGLIVGSLLYKFYCYVFLMNWRAGAYMMPGCMDALSLGALLAYLHQTNNDVWRRKLEKIPAILILLIQIILAVYTRNDEQRWFSYMFDTFLFAVFSFLVINKAAGRGLKGLPGWLTGNALCVHIGKISYGIYLYHTFVPDMVIWLEDAMSLTPRFAVHSLFLLLFVIGLAQLSWTLVERPVNSLKRYFDY